MKKMYKVLVTGACGVTSRSVVRSLRMSDSFKDTCVFIGTDVCINMYGVYEGLYDKIYYVPSCKSAQYQFVMQSIIEENEIEYAIVIPEPEVLYWSENPFPVKYLRVPPLFAKDALSKRRLYERLDGTGLTPRFQIVDRQYFLSDPNAVHIPYPLWIRDYSEGTTSASGAFLVKDYACLKAWLCINQDIETFMLSEYLPGRILACFLLYDNGELIKYGVAQRMEYIMAKVSVSRITGNTAKGKILNDEKTFRIAKETIRKLVGRTNEKINGLFTVDLREDKSGIPKVTEINLRPVAFTSILASAGLNFPEILMLLLTGRKAEIPSGLTKIVSEGNAILRDVDGLPLYVEDFKEITPGEYGPLHTSGQK